MSEQIPQPTRPESEGFEVFQVISHPSQAMAINEIKEFISKGSLADYGSLDEENRETGRQFMYNRNWKGENGAVYRGTYNTNHDTFSVEKYHGEGIKDREKLVFSPTIKGVDSYTVTWGASKAVVDQAHELKVLNEGEARPGSLTKDEKIGIAQAYTDSRLKDLLPEFTKSIRTRKRGRLARALGRRSAKNELNLQF